MATATPTAPRTKGVLVGRTGDGRWQVIDASDAGERVVDTLDGYEDDRPVRSDECTKRARHAPGPSDVGEELMGAADAIADMAQRVQLNGPEPTYASEKLSYALFKAAEGLALCEVRLAEVREEARRGHQHGVWLKEDAR